MAITALESTRGKTPRNFQIDPTGRWLYVCNQNSDRIERFAIDQETGRLSHRGCAADVGADLHPVHILMTGPREPLVQRVSDELGSVDILINCAGMNRREPIRDVKPETFDRLIDVNLRAPYFLSRAVLPGMLAQGGGKIINIGSLTTGLGGRKPFGLRTDEERNGSNDPRDGRGVGSAQHSSQLHLPRMDQDGPHATVMVRSGKVTLDSRSSADCAFRAAERIERTDDLFGVDGWQLHDGPSALRGRGFHGGRAMVAARPDAKAQTMIGPLIIGNVFQGRQHEAGR